MQTLSVLTIQKLVLLLAHFLALYVKPHVAGFALDSFILFKYFFLTATTWSTLGIRSTYVQILIRLGRLNALFLALFAFRGARFIRLCPALVFYIFSTVTVSKTISINPMRHLTVADPAKCKRWGALEWRTRTRGILDSFPNDFIWFEGS